jgi:hypothetical protein
MLSYLLGKRPSHQAEVVRQHNVIIQRKQAVAAAAAAAAGQAMPSGAPVQLQQLHHALA